MTLQTLRTDILNRAALCKAARLNYAALMKRLERNGPELTDAERKRITNALRKAHLMELDHG